MTIKYDNCPLCYEVFPVNEDNTDNHVCDLPSMEKVFNRLAVLEAKIDAIDTAITQTKDFVENIKDMINPLIDKISKNPIMRSFLS